MITRELEHPFYKMVLQFDESKPETDFEKDLIKKYKEFLDKQQEKRELMKDLRNRYFKEQLLVDDANQMLEELEKEFNELLPKVQDFAKENKGTVKKLNKLIEIYDKFAPRYFQFYEEHVKSIGDSISTNDDDYNILYAWFEDEEGSKVYEAVEGLSIDLYNNYDKYSLDITSYDRADDDMKGEWDKLRKEWDALFELREKTVASSSAFSDRWNEVNNQMKSVDDLFVEEKKKAKEKMNMTWIDTSVVQFIFLERKLYKGDMMNLQFRVDYDLELLKPEGWKLFVDVYGMAEKIVHFQVRSEFDLFMNEEDLVTDTVLKEVLKVSVENMIKACDFLYKQRKEIFNWSKFEFPKENMDFLLKNSLETWAEFDFEGAKRDNIFNDAITLDSNLVGGGTTLIINQVLYTNPLFDRINNQERFAKIIPIAIYISLNKIIQNMPKTPAVLNVDRLLCYVMSIDCAVQLLMSDHGPKIMRALDKVGYNESIRKQYLKAAQEFIDYFKEEMKRLESSFPDFEEFKDWESIVY